MKEDKGRKRKEERAIYKDEKEKARYRNINREKS